MRKNPFLILVPAVAAGLILSACAALKGTYTPPATHPEEIYGENPFCTDCHEPRDETLHYQRFDHTRVFVESHRMDAYQHERVCSMCHTQSFCNDCHVTRVELKPSIKNQTENYRSMPHRGDYLSRHRIDGRIDPASCFRCHGNPKSSETCAPCHG